VGDLEEK
jgi:hypothetical protein